MDELSTMNINITDGLAQLDMYTARAPPDANPSVMDTDTMKLIGIKNY